MSLDYMSMLIRRNDELRKKGQMYTYGAVTPDSTGTFTDILKNQQLITQSQQDGMGAAASNFFGSALSNALSLPVFAADRATDAAKYLARLATGKSDAEINSMFDTASNALKYHPYSLYVKGLRGGQKYSESMVTDPNSLSAQLGAIVGSTVPIIAGGAAAEGAFMAASRAVPALSWLGKGVNMGKLGQATYAQMAGLGAASAASTADVNWDQFSKDSSDPNKMTGAEYLTRIAANGVIGLVTAAVNPAWGIIKNAAVDAGVNAAGAAVTDLAAMAAANEKRRAEIGAQLSSNAQTQGAIGALAGTLFRGVGKLANRSTAAPASEFAPPSTPASNAIVTKIEIKQPSGYKPVAPDVSTGQGIDITPDMLLQGPEKIAEAHYVARSKMLMYLEQLPPETLASVAAKLDAPEVSPTGIVSKLTMDAAKYDPAQTGAGLKWMEGVFNTVLGANKPAAEAPPIAPVTPAPPPVAQAVEPPPMAPIPTEAPPAPVAEQPVTGAVPIEPAPIEKTQAQRDQELQALKQKESDFISNPTALQPGDKFLVEKMMKRGRGTEEVTIIESTSISPTEHSVTYTTSGKSGPQTKYYKLDESSGRWRTSTAVPSTAAKLLEPTTTGEPNVQPRPEDINVSEPGQREPVAGEPPTQAVEPSPVQQEEVVAPARTEGQAQEVTPVQQPIAGEPYATQEGQVTEGGQPEYLGVPQRENVQENIGEVRQEEGGRPGDSGRVVESGQEQIPIESAGERKTKQELIDDVRAAEESGNTEEAGRIRDRILTEFPSAPEPAATPEPAPAPEAANIEQNVQRTKSALKSKIATLSDEIPIGGKQSRAATRRIADNFDDVYEAARTARSNGEPISTVLDTYGVKGEASARLSAIIDSGLASESILPVVDNIDSALAAIDLEIQDRTKKGGRVKTSRADAIRNFLNGDGIELPLNRTGAKDQMGGAAVLDALYGGNVPSAKELRSRLQADKRLDVTNPSGERVAVLRLLPPESGKSTERILIEPSPEMLSAIKISRAIEGAPVSVISDVFGPVAPDIADIMAEDIQRGTADVATGISPSAGIGGEELYGGGGSLRQGDIAAQYSRQKYNLTKETKSEQYTQALNTVKDEYGAAYDIDDPKIISSLESELMAMGVKNPPKAVQEILRAERIAAVKDSANEIMRESGKQMPQGVTLRKRRKGGALPPLPSTQVQSVVGIIPYIGAQFLDDDTEYLPGMTGRTIKSMALAIGAFSMLHSVSKKPLLGLGKKSVPGASPRGPLVSLMRSIDDKGIFGMIRESRSSYKDRLAIMKDNVYQEARIRRMTQQEIDAKIAKNIEDDRKLDGMPFVPGVSSAASLEILSRYKGHEYPKQLMNAVQQGRLEAATLSVPMREARDFLEKLPLDVQGKISELAFLADKDLTDIVNKNIAGGYDRVVRPKIYEYRDNLRAKVEAQSPALLKAWDSWVALTDKARDNHYEAIALEQTGMGIDEGLVYYSDQANKIQDSMTELSAQIDVMDQQGYSEAQQVDALAVLHGMQNAYGVATKYRGLYAELRLSKQLSRDRLYMPRWMGGEEAIYKLRVKENATDPGQIYPAKSPGELAELLNDFNKEVPLEELGLTSRTLDDGTVVRSKADLYRAQKGDVSIIEGKGKQSAIIEASINPMVLRDAIEAISDNAVGGVIPAERFKVFYDLYKDDISKLVDVKTLQELQLSNRMGESVLADGGGIPVSKMRSLINAIAVPRVVDSTMHRTNVQGYAPRKVDPITGAPNANYYPDMISWVVDGLDHMERQVRSKTEEGSIRREANKQIADLVSRGIAPRYVKALAHIATGLRWNPNYTESILGSDQLTNAIVKADKGIALLGAFRLMGGNVVSAPKNVGLGYVTLMPEMVHETGGMFKAANTIRRAETAYWAFKLDKGDTKQAVTEYLRTADSIRMGEDKLNDAISSSDNARAAYRFAQNSGLFDASFYKSIERSFGGAVKEGSALNKTFEYSMLPSVMAENHNRGVSYMAGVISWLDKFPNDLNGAILNGLKIQDISQGNFSGYAKTGLERRLASMPGGRTFMLLKSAAIRTFEATSSHMLNVANRPTAKTVFVPLLGMLGASIVFGGLQGAPVTGDTYAALDALYNATVKDDEALGAVKENFYDYVGSQVVKMGAGAGLNAKQSRYIYDVLASGYMSAVTGKNFALDNNATSLITGDVPGFGTIKDFKDYYDAFGLTFDPIASSRLVNVQLGRIVKSGMQLAEGGKFGKGGYVVDDNYTPWQALGDVFLGSDKKEAMYGMNKVDGGGTLFFPDQADAYFSGLEKGLGLKMIDAIHKRPFQSAERGRAVLQMQPQAVNSLRNRIIANYYAMTPAMDNALARWEQMKQIPGVEEKLIFAAMKGQRGSRLSDQVKKQMRDSENMIKKYYLAHSVQLAYQQMGIPAPAYKYTGADPLRPLLEFLDNRFNSVGKQVTPTPENLPEEQYIEEE